MVITQVPGKGRGLVASRDIDAGELILKDKIVVTHPRNAILLSEEDRSAVVVQDHGNNEDVFNLPRISYPRNSLLQQVEKLSKSEQEEFWQLSCKDDKYGHVYEKGSKLRALGIMMTNGMFFNDTRNNVDLCLSIALINNSCLPNCVDHPTLEDQNIREVRAVENIKKGEEITISYETNSMYEKKAVRQKKIKKHWDFDCICSRCAEGDVQEEMDLKVSMDKLMAMMAAASSSIPDMMMTKTWEKLATWEDKQIDLLRRVSFASIQMPHELASMVKFAQLGMDLKTHSLSVCMAFTLNNSCIHFKVASILKVNFKSIYQPGKGI